MGVQRVFGEIYPLTIIRDRYNGTYSGGKYVAFNAQPCDIPDEVYGGDMDCSNFWEEVDIPYGIGETPEKAVLDLISK